MLYEMLSKIILDAVYAVHRELGPGLLEQCYHNALFYEFKAGGVSVDYNRPFTGLISHDRTRREHDKGEDSGSVRWR